MIEFTAIETIVMTYAPLLVTILGIVVAFIKMVGAINNLRKDTKKSDEEKTSEIKALKEQMNEVLRENADLKVSLKELLTKIDKRRH